MSQHQTDLRPSMLLTSEKGYVDGGPHFCTGSHRCGSLLARANRNDPADVSKAGISRSRSSYACFLRKEVIQPQVPLRLPCYDFTPVADLTVVGCLLAVSPPASGKTNSHGVTGGVYKARERIHRGVLIRDY